MGRHFFTQGEEGLEVVLDQIDWLIAKGYAVFRMTPHGLVTLTRDFKTRSKCLTLLAIKTTAVGYRNGGSASECLDRELAADPSRKRFDDSLSHAQKQVKKLATDDGLHWSKADWHDPAVRKERAKQMVGLQQATAADPYYQEKCAHA